MRRLGTLCAVVASILLVHEAASQTLPSVIEEDNFKLKIGELSRVVEKFKCNLSVPEKLNIDSKTWRAGKEFYFVVSAADTNLVKTPYNRAIVVNQLPDSVLAYLNEKFPKDLFIKFKNQVPETEIANIYDALTKSTSQAKEMKKELENLAVQANPNPFNPSTTIHYTVTKPDNFTFTIYNSLGKEVMHLPQAFRQPGTYAINVNLGSSPSDMYLFVMQGNQAIGIYKLLLVK